MVDNLILFSFRKITTTSISIFLHYSNRQIWGDSSQLFFADTTAQQLELSKMLIRTKISLSPYPEPKAQAPQYK